MRRDKPFLQGTCLVPPPTTLVAVASLAEAEGSRDNEQPLEGLEDSADRFEVVELLRICAHRAVHVRVALALVPGQAPNLVAARSDVGEEGSESLPELLARGRGAVEVVHAVVGVGRVRVLRRYQHGRDTERARKHPNGADQGGEELHRLEYVVSLFSFL
jgi:hypothetical protein